MKMPTVSLSKALLSYPDLFVPKNQRRHGGKAHLLEREHLSRGLGCDVHPCPSPQTCSEDQGETGKPDSSQGSGILQLAQSLLSWDISPRPGAVGSSVRRRSAPSPSHTRPLSPCSRCGESAHVPGFPVSGTHTWRRKDGCWGPTARLVAPRSAVLDRSPYPGNQIRASSLLQEDITGHP